MLVLWRDSVNFVIVGKNEEFALGILNEGGWFDSAFRSFADFGVTSLAPVLEIKAPNVAMNKVSINILPLKFRNCFSTIMYSSGDRESAAAIIFMDWVNEFGSLGWSVGPGIS